MFSGVLLIYYGNKLCYYGKINSVTMEKNYGTMDKTIVYCSIVFVRELSNTIILANAALIKRQCPFSAE